MQKQYSYRTKIMQFLWNYSEGLQISLAGFEISRFYFCRMLVFKALYTKQSAIDSNSVNGGLLSMFFDYIGSVSGAINQKYFFI